MFAVGISGLAHIHGWRAADDRPINAHNVWRALSHRDLTLPRTVGRLLRDHVLTGNAVWDQSAWDTFIQELLPLFAPYPEGAKTDLTAFCSFVVKQKLDFSDSKRRSTKQIQFDELTLQLGSIHSVKGKSVDGILIVESEIWKGSKDGEQCVDLSAVLPRAFGVTNQSFSDVELSAATNVFVGVTRTRELLGLAIRKPESAMLIDKAIEQGWKVVDLVKT